VPPLITPKLITDSDAEGGSDRHIRPPTLPKDNAGQLDTSLQAKKGKESSTVTEAPSALIDRLAEKLMPRPSPRPPPRAMARLSAS